MSETQLLPDDPRLTAYALGELDPSEEATVERLLADSPAAQAALREIRDLAGLLTTELKQEPAPALTAAQRTAILEGKVSTVAPRPATRGRTSHRWISQFAALATMAAVIALAAFLPAPGNRSGDSQPVEFFAQDRFGDRSARVDLQLAQRGESSDFGLVEQPTGELGRRELGSRELASEVTSLSELSVVTANALSRKLPAKDEIGAALGGTENLTVRDGAPMSGESFEARGTVADDGVRASGRFTGKFRKMSEVDKKDGSGSGKESGDVFQAARPGAGFAPADSKPGAGAGGGRGRQRSATHPTSEYDRDESKSTTGWHAENEKMRQEGGGGALLPGVAGSKSREAGDKSLDGAKPADGERRSHFSAIVKGIAERSAGGPQGQPAPAGSEPVIAESTRLKAYRGYHDFAEKELDQRVKEARDDLHLAYKRLTDVEHAEGLGRAWHESAPGTEAYDPILENSFLSSYEDPLSTFGIDVDTASYANVRRFLTQQQQLPPRNAVRIEELVNYFSYEYPPPAGDQPFAVNVEAGRCPWNPTNGLVRIGLKGREIDRDKRPASNLVFLVDVSGSMQAENKLPLVKMGLNLLTQQMTESDKVAIVTYSDTAVQRLPSTNGTNKAAINGVIDSLQAGGSTNGAGGIQLAYRAAVEHFISGGTNRVILLTDGDFNVGVTGDDELVKLIQERARTKVFFSVLGFGMGNLKDGKLEKLADKGNGQYAYIDSQQEARKVFVEDLAGTLVTIAKDVKLQVEFNPAQVGAYRLLGYENRVMAAQDFNNDAKDAGDIGAGHTVTALYETIPAGEAPKPLLGDTLRYRSVVVPKEGGLANELLTVKLRYKLPEGDTSTLVEVPITDPKARVAGGGGQPNPPSPPRMTRDFNWAAAVAAFGMILRDSQFRGQANFDMVLELAQGSLGEDKGGHRKEFIELVKSAKALYGGVSPAADRPTATQPVAPLTREQAEAKAGMNGKYVNLLRIVEAPVDAAAYGSFHDFGRWEGSSYAGQNDLPKGYWVYVSPNWYIWGDEAQQRRE